jgi:hypothetical protein
MDRIFARTHHLREHALSVASAMPAMQAAHLEEIWRMAS